jgi:hypothetical protein
MSNNGDFFRALMEVFTTKQSLSWTRDYDSFVTNFEVDGNEYGITIRQDDFDGIIFYDVNFYLIKNNSISHSSTNFDKNQFKILGIVVNGIQEKIPDAGLVYFAAKLGDSANRQEYDSKVKLYSRIVRKMSVGLNMMSSVIKVTGEETVFLLARDSNILERFKNSV